MDKKISYIKERILEIADYKRISKEKFIENFGMTYGNFKGKQKLTSLNSDFLDKILSEIPEINAEWLLTGKGSMLKEPAQPVASSSQSQENDKYTSLLEKQVAILERENTYQAKEIQRLEKEIQRLGGKKIYSLEDKIEYQRQELIAKDNEILALKSPGAETYNAPVSPKRV